MGCVLTTSERASERARFQHHGELHTFTHSPILGEKKKKNHPQPHRIIRHRGQLSGHMDGLRARCDAMLDRAVFSQICAAQLSRSIDWLRTAQHSTATHCSAGTHTHTHADVQHTEASVMYFFSLRGLNLQHLFDLGVEHEAPRGATATFSPPAVLRCLRYAIFFFRVHACRVVLPSAAGPKISSIVTFSQARQAGCVST